jgi:hypothetical protein
MILTVPTISPSTTGLCSGSVAAVIASSISLRRSTAPLSTTSTPAPVANRFERPVNGRSTETPSPASASASSLAASSSPTSSGSSRTATTLPIPAAEAAPRPPP